MEELQDQMNDDEVKSRVRSFFPGTASYVVVKAILSVSSTVSRWAASQTMAVGIHVEINVLLGIVRKLLNTDSMFQSDGWNRAGVDEKKKTGDEHIPAEHRNKAE